MGSNNELERMRIKIPMIIIENHFQLVTEPQNASMFQKPLSDLIKYIGSLQKVFKIICSLFYVY